MPSSMYNILVFSTIILATVVKAQLTSTTLCQTVVPSFNCSLEQENNICGSNGVTYPTGCDFAKAHCKDLTIKIDYQGPCSCQPLTPDPICASLLVLTCPLNSFPVCGSDGNTYLNFCAFQQVKCLIPKVQLNSLGSCPTVTPATTTTTTPATTTTQSILEIICQSLEAIACQSGQPEVCGSDGLTYANACELEKVNCKSDTGIKFVQDGPC